MWGETDILTFSMTFYWYLHFGVSSNVHKSLTYLSFRKCLETGSGKGSHAKKKYAHICTLSIEGGGSNQHPNFQGTFFLLGFWYFPRGAAGWSQSKHIWFNFQFQFGQLKKNSSTFCIYKKKCLISVQENSPFSPDNAKCGILII